jgi:hypothetical protein
LRDTAPLQAARQVNAVVRRLVSRCYEVPMPIPDFVSYAFQDLPRKKVKKYAAQYEGVDMAALIGADEDNFPFLIRSDPDSRDDEPDAFEVMVWNAYNGMMARWDEDPVRHYAAVLYLREHAYPVFTSFCEAERWALEHDWPRKPRG